MTPDIAADGIALVDNRAFQSFVRRLNLSGSRKRKVFVIPRKIEKHLHLEHDDIVEIAIRKVTKEYAEREYGVTFWSFTTTCPKCGREGRLNKMINGFMVVHYRKGNFPLCHFVPKDVAKELIEKEAVNLG